MQSEAQILSGLVTEHFCFLCDRNLQGINQAIGHLTSRLHKDNLSWMKKHVFDYFNFAKEPSASLLYCFVCRRYFTSKELLQKHVAAFPHGVLAKAKSNLVKEGIREEFALSVEMGKYMDCIICNLDLLNQNSAHQHINSSAHKRELSNWKTYLPKHNSKIPTTESCWFYCNICCESLDGTTEAAKHYRKHSNTLHLANGHIYNSGTQSVDNNNVSKVTVQKTAPKVTPLPAAPIQIANPKVTDNINKKENLLPKKCDDNHTDSKLKESVYEQLEKLIQTLYYSKKVPYDVSLQYLKKVNKEVEEIVKEQSKDDSQISSLSQSTTGISLSTASSINFEVNKPPPLKLDLTSSEPILPSPVSTKETVSQNNVPVKNSIPNLLCKVKKQKLEVTQQNKDVVEIQVLDEMEILLKEVYKEGAPLEEILKCLEKFNKELDEQFIQAVPVDTGGELDSDPIKENVTNDTLDSKQISEDSNTKDTELVSNPKLTYTQPELLNLQQSAKHICTNPDMMHLLISLDLYKFTNNCTSYNSIYSYYTFTNFNLFMDFLDVYLQTSVEMCQKESSMFQTNLGLLETTQTELTPIEEKPVLEVNSFGCEFSYNTFYDYYTGSDFEAFMDFRSQYLYCSIEESLDLPNEESNSISENQVPDEDSMNDHNNSLSDYYECEEI